LYTTSDGQRRIRTHNLAIPITQNIEDVYEHIDITATATFLARKALNQFNKMANIEASKQIAVNTVVNIAKGMMR